MEWYYVCWPWLTAKRVEPVVSISWASCLKISWRDCSYIPGILSLCCVLYCGMTVHFESGNVLLYNNYKAKHCHFQNVLSSPQSLLYVKLNVSLHWKFLFNTPPSMTDAIQIASPIDRSVWATRKIWLSFFPHGQMQTQQLMNNDQ